MITQANLSTGMELEARIRADFPPRVLTVDRTPCWLSKNCFYGDGLRELHQPEKPLQLSIAPIPTLSGKRLAKPTVQRAPVQEATDTSVSKKERWLDLLSLTETRKHEAEAHDDDVTTSTSCSLSDLPVTRDLDIWSCSDQ